MELVRALQALQQADGGFAGLAGHSDPYYTAFAWLSLRALRAPCDRARVCSFMKGCRPKGEMDRWCVRLLLAVESGRGSLRLWLPALLRGDAYGAFLGLLAAGRGPRWLCRLAWARLAPGFSDAACARLPTPRLAAGLLLAAAAGSMAPGLRQA